MPKRNFEGENQVLRQQKHVMNSLKDNLSVNERTIADLRVELAKEQQEHKATMRHGNQLLVDRDKRIAELEAQQKRDVALLQDLIVLLRRG